MGLGCCGRGAPGLSPLCAYSLVSIVTQQGIVLFKCPPRSLLGKKAQKNRGVCLEHSVLKTFKYAGRDGERRRHLGGITKSPTLGNMRVTEQLSTLESSRWATKVAKALQTLHCFSEHRSSETTWIPTCRRRGVWEEGGQEDATPCSQL